MVTVAGYRLCFYNDLEDVREELDSSFGGDQFELFPLDDDEDCYDAGLIVTSGRSPEQLASLIDNILDDCSGVDCFEETQVSRAEDVDEETLVASIRVKLLNHGNEPDEETHDEAADDD